MTLSINVQSSDLLKFARQLEEQPKRNKTLIANALNETGRGMVREIINTISDETGMPVEMLARLVKIRTANRNRHDFTVDMSAIYSPEATDPRTGSRWGKKSRTEFVAEELVNVQTAEDEKVCPECERIAEEGPYSLGEAQTLIPHHPNCRCTLVPYVSRKRLAFTFEQSTGAQRRVRGGIRHIQQASLSQLAQKVSREMIVQLRVK